MTSETPLGPLGQEISQAQRTAWLTVVKAQQAALEARKIELKPAELHLVTRFFLHELEGKGLRIVPIKPTRAMLDASLAALDPGNRLGEGRVRPRTKHRWRLVAAIEAALDWRPGERAERAKHGLK